MAETKFTPGPVAEAIANADAFLNNAALPTYSTLVEQHAELLEVLQALVSEYGKQMASMRVDSPRRSVWRDARAAISRATGKAA